ncbi:MAG: sugar phosphate isomerase/epimerase [Clostridia bacterium]|nr:sugar phosphate isomerase/epimerase [Clostridia bacterium]
MYKQKLCLALSGGYGISYEEQIKLFKATGFEGCAIDLSDKNADAFEIARVAKEENMMISYLHAPFNKSDDMWMDGEIGDVALAELLDCLEICSKLEISVMVVHAFIGFDSDNIPTSIGIERYGALAVRANELGVKLAIENTEGEEYLAALMKELSDIPSVSFCWDSGHELCYNYGKDLLELYGDKLAVTHINDNLGIRDFDGSITYIDDLHLLPFDGITDWKAVAERIVRCGFDGPLSFELTTRSKPNRHENDKYAAMPIERFVSEAYIRACRVADLVIKEKEKNHE